jgi:hypothetical protein
MRKEKIDGAICAAGNLIGTLLDHGPINPAQAGVIITAAVRAVVPNVEPFEIRERAKVIVAEMSKLSEGKV